MYTWKKTWSLHAGVAACKEKLYKTYEKSSPANFDVKGFTQRETEKRNLDTKMDSKEGLRDICFLNIWTYWKYEAWLWVFGNLF